MEMLAEHFQRPSFLVYFGPNERKVNFTISGLIKSNVCRGLWTSALLSVSCWWENFTSKLGFLLMCVSKHKTFIGHNEAKPTQLWWNSSVLSFTECYQTLP